jgi:hypothetical protein
MNAVWNTVAPMTGKLFERGATQWLAVARATFSWAQSIPARSTRWILSEREQLTDVLDEGRARYDLIRTRPLVAPQPPPRVSSSGSNRAA